MGYCILVAIFDDIFNLEKCFFLSDIKKQKFVYVMYELNYYSTAYLFVLEDCDKRMHLCFNIDACPMHSPFRFTWRIKYQPAYIILSQIHSQK